MFDRSSLQQHKSRCKLDDNAIMIILLYDSFTSAMSMAFKTDAHGFINM